MLKELCLLRKIGRFISAVAGNGCLLGAATLVCCAATSFEVEGTLRRTYFKPLGGVKAMTNWFKTTVVGCRSIIRTGGMDDLRVAYFEYSSDGTNSALLVQYRPSDAPPQAFVNRGGRSEEVKSPQSKVVLNDAMLIINSGHVPEYEYGLITPVWLAYASACFYQEANSNKVEPVFNMGSGFRENHLKVQCEWQLTQEPPGMLAWMCDFRDGYLYRQEHSTLIKQSLPSALKGYTTNAYYTVDTWTNVDSLRLPREWNVVRYRPNLRTEQLEVESVTRGHTHLIRPGTSCTNFTPSMPDNTRIVDRTLESKGLHLYQYAYNTFNGHIFTIEELKARANFQKSLEAARSSPSLARTRKVLIILMCLIIAFPLVFAFWTKFWGKFHQTQ